MSVHVAASRLQAQLPGRGGHQRCISGGRLAPPVLVRGNPGGEPSPSPGDTSNQHRAQPGNIYIVTYSIVVSTSNTGAPTPPPQTLTVRRVV